VIDILMNIMTNMDLGAIERLHSHDATTREATAQAITSELGVSKNTVKQVLPKPGYRKVKPTFKPGLTAAMKKAWLDFARAHRHWTLENLKHVIWTDETSVILRHQHGMIHIWRHTGEAMDPTVIQCKWKKRRSSCFGHTFPTTSRAHV
jgi:hypothetical protein